MSTKNSPKATRTEPLHQIPELLTRQQIAEFYGISPRTMQRHAEQGTGPTPITEIDRTIRYSRREFENWAIDYGASKAFRDTFRSKKSSAPKGAPERKELEDLLRKIVRSELRKATDEIIGMIRAELRI